MAASIRRHLAGASTPSSSTSTTRRDTSCTRATPRSTRLRDWRGSSGTCIRAGSSRCGRRSARPRLRGGPRRGLRPVGGIPRPVPQPADRRVLDQYGLHREVNPCSSSGRGQLDDPYALGGSDIDVLDDPRSGRCRRRCRRPWLDGRGRRDDRQTQVLAVAHRLRSRTFSTKRREVGGVVTDSCACGVDRDRDRGCRKLLVFLGAAMVATPHPRNGGWLIRVARHAACRSLIEPTGQFSPWAYRRRQVAAVAARPGRPAARMSRGSAPIGTCGWGGRTSPGDLGGGRASAGKAGPPGRRFARARPRTM